MPMLPVVRGERETRRQILLYTVLLYAVTQLPFCAGGFGAIYLVASLVLGLGFIARRGAPVPPRRPPLGAAAVPVLARLPRAAVLRDGRRCRTCRIDRRLFFAPIMNRRLARKNIRTGADRRRRSACSCSASRSSSPRSTSHEPARSRDPARRRGDPPARAEHPAAADRRRDHAALVGVTTFIEFTVVGAILLTVVCVVRWIKDTRREIDELPLD